MTKKTILAGLLVMALAVLANAALAKPGNGSSKRSAKAKKTLEIKNYEKSTAGKSDATLYREKTQKAAKELKKTGEELQTAEEPGTTEEQQEVGEEVEQVADETQQAGDDTADAIEQVETRNKFKTALIGTDYKNLGQLRSSLVHNRNQIRKLTQLIAQTTDPTAQAALQAQLTILAQERERVKTIITEQESTFSVLGWVVKFLTGYEETPLETEDEQSLNDEVTDALTDDTTTDTTTGTTDTTGTTGTTDTTGTTGTTDTTGATTGTVPADPAQ